MGEGLIITPTMNQLIAKLRQFDIREWSIENFPSYVESLFGKRFPTNKIIEEWVKFGMVSTNNGQYDFSPLLMAFEQMHNENPIPKTPHEHHEYADRLTTYRRLNPSDGRPDELLFKEWALLDKLQFEQSQTEKPNIKTLFNEQTNEFVPMRLADFVKKSFHLFTRAQDDTLFVWKNGIYIEGEAMIRDFCQSCLNEETKSRRVDEVLYCIKTSTYLHDGIEEPPEYLISLENGILNIENDTFFEHNCALFFTNKIPVRYDENAKCPNIEKFLSEVVSEKDKKTLIEWAAYCLYRRHHIHKALMLIGSGSNGKSKYLDLLTEFLGRKNVSHMTLQSLCTNRFAVANLHGKHANFFADLPKNSLYETGIFKALTGQDEITGENKFKNSFSFMNHAKLAYSCNQIPQSIDDTDAFFRRWIVVNFPNQFLGEKDDKNLLAKLTTEEELSGFLNLSIDALSALLKRGYFENDEGIETIREKWQRLSTPVASFVQDCIEIDSQNVITKEELYAKFIEYCVKNDLASVAKNTFSKELPRYAPSIREERPEINGRRTYAWRGIRLKGEIENNTEPPDKTLNDYTGDSA